MRQKVKNFDDFSKNFQNSGYLLVIYKNVVYWFLEFFFSSLGSTASIF